MINKRTLKVAIAIDNTSKSWTTEYFNIFLEMLLDYGIEFVMLLENPIDELQAENFKNAKKHIIRYHNKIMVAFGSFQEFDNNFAFSHIYIGIETIRQKHERKLLQNDIPIFADENYFLVILDNNNLSNKEYFPFVFTYINNANDIVGIVEDILEANGC